MNRNTLWWLVMAVVLVHMSLYLLAYRFFFLQPFDVARMGKIYSYSPYVRGSGSKIGIGDDGLYAFAGYYYFFDRGDVSSVNFEHPPLGKYLIGLSIWATGNENAINIGYFLVLLWVTYALARKLGLSSVPALLSVLVVALDPLLLDHLRRSLLDLPFALCFLLSIYFFLPVRQGESHYSLSHFFLGCAFAIRFYPFFVIHYLFYLLWVFYRDRQHLWRFLMASVWTPVIYLVAHTAYFYYHPSLIEFLRYKKWMLAWFTGSPHILGNVWSNVITGWYLDSTGGVTHNPFWSPLLPLLILLALSSVGTVLSGSRARQAVAGMIGLYLLYVTVLTNGDQKFLLPIYPLLCILAIGQIQSFYSIMMKRHGSRATHRDKI